MRGAKPSSGLVHLHKSFVELHFAGRSLPQSVSVVACVDGKQLSTVLPGQVYSTSCGADHWLLGLQLVFKAYKEPVITHVDKTGDSEITVAISTQGIQDKYNSDDPVRRAELQQVMEAAALKFAQTAVRRKEGRLQITGPNINIPKKQLRAQWPAILERLAPQDVQAHMFVDNPDQYISCAAKIIATKAKAEPVFYLSGLSQLLKTYMGAFVTLELFPANKVVRLNVDTGQSKTAAPSLSTTAATSEPAGDIDSAATPSAAKLCMPRMAASIVTEAGSRAPADTAGHAATARVQTAAAEGGRGRLLSEPGHERSESTSRRVSEANGGSCGQDGWSCKARPGPFATAEAAHAAAATGADSGGAHGLLDPRYPPQLTSSEQLRLWREQQQQLQLQHAALAPAAVVDSLPGVSTQQQQLPAGMLEGMCSSSVSPWFNPAIGMSGQLLAAAHVSLPRLQPPVEAAATGAEVLTGTPTAAGVGSSDSGVLQSTVLAPSGVSVGSEAGLWLLADHAAQLQAVGSSGNIASEVAAGVQRQSSRGSGPTGSVSCSQAMEPVQSPAQGVERKTSEGSRLTVLAGKPVGVSAAAADAEAAWKMPAASPAMYAATAAAAHQGAKSPAAGACTADGDDGIHPAALPQDCFSGMATGVKQKNRGVDDHDSMPDQYAEQLQVKRRRTSSTGVIRAAAADGLVDHLPPPMSLQLTPRPGHDADFGTNAAALQEQWSARRARLRQSELSCPSLSEGLHQLPPSYSAQGMQLQHTAYYATGCGPAHGTAAQLGAPGSKEARSHLSPCLAPGALLAAALMGSPAATTSSDDAVYLAQHSELHGETGAVAVIHRVNSQGVVTCQAMKTSSGARSQHVGALTTAAGRAPASTGADWSPAQHCSPRSGTSSITRHAPARTSSGPGSCSPADAAAAAANAAAGAGRESMLHPGAVEGPWLSSEGWASTAVVASRHQHQAWWPGGDTSSPAWRPAAGDQAGYTAGHYARAADLQQHQHMVDMAGTSATAHGSMPLSPEATAVAQHQQQTGGGGTVVGDWEWPELPDADNLMLVGKGLVQVMNLLGAGTAARLALTRSLRVMSPQDREWLLSITYPHLQDSCRRRAIPEMKLILSEIAGMDCFAATDGLLQAPGSL